MIIIKIKKFTDKIANLNETAKTIISSISKKDPIKVLEDTNSIEITAGNNSLSTSNNDIVVDLIFKKTITIDANNFSDKRELDKFIKDITNFYDQSKVIENKTYIPPELRS